MINDYVYPMAVTTCFFIYFIPTGIPISNRHNNIWNNSDFPNLLVIVSDPNLSSLCKHLKPSVKITQYNLGKEDKFFSPISIKYIIYCSIIFSVKTSYGWLCSITSSRFNYNLFENSSINPYNNKHFITFFVRNFFFKMFLASTQ